MADTSNKIRQNCTQNLTITFRKMIVKPSQLNNTKIMVAIKTNVYDQKSDSDSQYNSVYYQISQPRIVKNGLVCFYGECIVLNQTIKNFYIKVITDNGVNGSSHRKEFAKFFVGPQKLKQIAQKRTVISSVSSNIELVWQAKLNDDLIQKINYFQQERSLQDFQDIEPKKQQENADQLYSRKLYSPAIKGEIRRKRDSLELKRKDNRSQKASSQSPHKRTMDTHETIEKIKNKVMQSILTNNKNQKKIIKQFKLPTENKRPFCQQRFEKKKDETNYHPVLNPTKEAKSFSHRLSQPPSPKNRSQKNPHIISKRKSQKFYQKISLKSILYTSVIGIIGGVTAAQL